MSSNELLPFPKIPVTGFTPKNVALLAHAYQFQTNLRALSKEMKKNSIKLISKSRLSPFWKLFKIASTSKPPQKPLPSPPPNPHPPPPSLPPTPHPPPPTPAPIRSKKSCINVWYVNFGEEKGVTCVLGPVNQYGYISAKKKRSVLISSLS